MPLGVGQYIRWCAGGGGERVFYEHAGCKDLYKRYVSHVVNRINTYNGRRYKNDPTIFTWELANVPHIVDGVKRSGQIVRNWIREMAAFVKFHDPNHMVATGEEGYDVTTAGYGPVASAYSGQNWLFDGNKGLAWTQNTADPNIDYAASTSIRSSGSSRPPPAAPGSPTTSTSPAPSPRRVRRQQQYRDHVPELASDLGRRGRRRRAGLVTALAGG